jgi:adenosylcobinamide-phosphate synthase
MTAFVIVTALLLDWMLGEPRRWHPLVGFGRMAHRLEAWLNPCYSPGTAVDAPGVRGYVLGTLALLLAVAPPVAALLVIDRYPPLAALTAVGTLYLVIGHRSLHEHAIAVEHALERDDLPAARQRVSRMVSRDTFDMDASRVAGAAVESVLENGNDAIFGALFWFLVAGAPGTLAYRLVNTLDAMWGYRTPRYRRFGWAAARLDDVLNLVPARLTALSYALVGHAATAVRCWRLQAPSWESPNAGPVMAAGAGALGVRLGGGAFYHGCWRERPPLGDGPPPHAADITRARRLLVRSLALWVALIILIVLIAERTRA